MDDTFRVQLGYGHCASYGSAFVDFLNNEQRNSDEFPSCQDGHAMMSVSSVRLNESVPRLLAFVVSVFPSSTFSALTEQSISEGVSVSMPTRACPDVRVVCVTERLSSGLEDNIMQYVNSFCVCGCCSCAVLAPTHP